MSPPQNMANILLDWDYLSLTLCDTSLCCYENGRSEFNQLDFYTIICQ